MARRSETGRTVDDVPGGSRVQRQTRALVTTVGFALGLLATHDAGAVSYTLTVDASKPQGSLPHFWSASVGTGTASLTLRADLQTHYKIANRELGMMRVRGHGVLNDDIGIYKAPGTYDFTKLDTYLTAILSAGMRPIMELDFMPTALAMGGDYHSSPKDYSAYKDFIQAVVQHCVDKYTADDVAKWYWEVWNEPDYPGFWNGTDKNASASAKMADYYLLYDAAVDAATAVLPNILIGGPGSTYYAPIGDFLKHCKSAHKRVTFVSSHCYPGGDGSSPVSAQSCVDDNSSRISQITGAGYTTAEVKSFNTEWNSSYSGQGGGTTDGLVSMDSHANAPFILKTVKLLSDKNLGDLPPVEVFSYWAVSDVFGEHGLDADSYILQQGGTLPFGSVFGLLTFQGIRKAAFNGFKLLNYLGPERLAASGGVGGDGVDLLAAQSASADEVQILVYNYYSTIKTTGSDNVTVNVTNLPAALAGKEIFITQFIVDDSHSNPYAIWVNQGKPKAPTETQWQALRRAQHLALLQPVIKKTVDATFSTTVSLKRQAGMMILLGLKRPLTGRNAFVEIEGEDFDGQSGVTKENSGDSTLGQSIVSTNGGQVFFEKVDYSDDGVDTVQLRVKSEADASVELRSDSPTGTLLGTCAVSATANEWANQTCALSQPIAGVGRLYLIFSGAMHLNWLQFQRVGTVPLAGVTTPTGSSGTDDPVDGGTTDGSAATDLDGSVGGSADGGRVVSTGGTTASGGKGSGCGCRVGDSCEINSTRLGLVSAGLALGLLLRRKRRRSF